MKKQAIRVLAFKKGEGVARFLDESLNIREIRFDKDAEPEFEVIQHPTLEVVRFEPLELRHRTGQ
jgi:hypothetical protein